MARLPASLLPTTTPLLSNSFNFISMVRLYQQHGAASALDSQPSLNTLNSGSSASTSYTAASCSSAGGHYRHYPECARCESLPHRFEADCSPDGRRPLRRETHVTSPPGQALRGRWEVDTSENSPRRVAAHPNKTLKALCGKTDLRLEVLGKAPLDVRIQITGRLHPKLEVITEYGDGLIEIARHGSQRFRLTARTLGGNLIIRIPEDFCGKLVANVRSSVTLSPNAAKLLSGPRTTTVGLNGSVTEYSTGLTCAEERVDGKPLRFLDFVHVFPGEGSARVLVGDEGLIRTNGLVSGLLGAKQWAEDEMARRRSSSRRP